VIQVSIYRQFRARLTRLVCMFLMVAALAGCKTDIYTGLTEREANEMLAALLEQDIAAWKAIDNDLFKVNVREEDLREALSVLEAKGLPRGSRKSIGEVFAGGGIVSSPFEERVRYVYALGEEVAQTLQQMDEVVVARVHIVMPEDPELGEKAKPSSAAVFIKHRADRDLTHMNPQIRRLVSNAIDGVGTEQVSIVLVRAQPLADKSKIAPDTIKLTEILPGLRVAADVTSTFWMWVAGACAVVLALLVLAIVFGLRSIGLSRKLRNMPREEDMA
jgi:type III secretion protein J